MIRGATLFYLLFAVVAAVSTPSSPEVPPAYPALPDGRILTSCQLTNGGVAVSMANSDASGAYYIVVPGSEPAMLDQFAEGGGLACYSPEEATRLNNKIRDSEGISGDIFPGGSGTVICGFVSSVEAECWQFDHDGNIKRVGGWIT